MRRPIDIIPPPLTERAVLVGHAGREHDSIDLSIEELALLADTAGARSRMSARAPTS